MVSTRTVLRAASCPNRAMRSCRSDGCGSILTAILSPALDWERRQLSLPKVQGGAVEAQEAEPKRP